MNHRCTTSYTIAALIALGRHRGSDTRRPFTALDLVRWVPKSKFPKASYADLAIANLVKRRDIEKVGDSTIRAGIPRPIYSWRLTGTGSAAALSAFAADRASNPADYGDLPREPVDPLAARTWSLLRIRRALTADEAAGSLVDAGDDIPAIRRQIGALLLAWSRRFPESLQISAKHIGGFKRFVLLKDLGGTPPAIRVRRPTKA